MDKIFIEGPNQLFGKVSISGAKNAALPILASSLLAKNTSIFKNIPKLGDVKTILILLKHLGVQVEVTQDAIKLCSDAVQRFEAPYDLVKTMRASILVLGPLIARFHRAVVSLPGGCAIGQRPVNLHLDALQKLGAEIKLQNGYVYAKSKRLIGTKIKFESVTVTGTENIMMAATLAKGGTQIVNAACEPEVIDLANALNAMRARISGAGTRVIEVEGVEALQGVNYSVMSDRIEAGTFLIAVSATGGDVLIQNCNPKYLSAAIDVLKKAGVKIQEQVSSMRVQSNGDLTAIKVETEPYPGFPTDLQAQLMAMLTQANGKSVIYENIFENRFNHVAEMQRMGAKIRIQDHKAHIFGKTPLTGAPLMATDLRASASLVIGGLVAKGRTEISRVYHLDRGYEALEEKLKVLGANIFRQKEGKEVANAERVSFL